MAPTNTGSACIQATTSNIFNTTQYCPKPLTDKVYYTSYIILQYYTPGTPNAAINSTIV